MKTRAVPERAARAGCRATGLAHHTRAPPSLVGQRVQGYWPQAASEAGGLHTTLRHGASVSGAEQARCRMFSFWPPFGLGGDGGRRPPRQVQTRPQGCRSPDVKSGRRLQGLHRSAEWMLRLLRARAPARARSVAIRTVRGRATLRHAACWAHADHSDASQP